MDNLLKKIANDYSSYYTYDECERLIQTRYGNGGKICNAYDLNGNLIVSIPAQENATYGTEAREEIPL